MPTQYPPPPLRNKPTFVVPLRKNHKIEGCQLPYPPQKWLCLSPSENAIHRWGRVWILNGMALHTHSHTLEYFCKHIIWCNFTAHSWWSVSELGYFMNIKNFGCFSQDNIYSKLYSSSMGQLACWNLQSAPSLHSDFEVSIWKQSSYEACQDLSYFFCCF